MAKDSDQHLETLRTQCEQLRAENARLRKELAKLGAAAPVPPPVPDLATTERHRDPPVTATSSAETKIALFRALFRGREDVYAVRWQRADGRSGYSPRAQRDWKAYLSSEAADRRTVDRETRTLLPLTDDVIRQHLQGEITIGVYPLLSDETCWFLAVDFDKKTWQEDARAFAAICGEKGVPAAIERSRSGNGAHVWIFFEQPVPAATARRLGCALLTAAMERRHQIGLDSYDRLFPSQDTMPKGGFGNLIALPLQKAPRQAGNSVFVDDQLAPYSDQWAFLAGTKRMSIHAAESIVEHSMQSGGVIGVRLSHSDDDEPDPWTLPPSGRRVEKAIPGPLPSSVSVVRANLLFLEKAGLPSPLVNRVLRIAAFQNPDRGHETGWPPWWVPTRAEIAPYPYDGAIECWMRESRFDANSDYWRASPEGKLFLLRSYQEDFEGGFETGEALVISSHLWTMGEVLLHAHRLAQALSKQPLRVAFRCRWDGLEGRCLASWEHRAGLPVRQSRTNRVTSELRCTTDEIADALPELVRRFTKPLFQAFDFFAPTPQYVEREMEKLRKSRV